MIIAEVLFPHIFVDSWFIYACRRDADSGNWLMIDAYGDLILTMAGGQSIVLGLVFILRVVSCFRWDGGKRCLYM